MNTIDRAQAIRDSYNVDASGRITDPGRFEGEPIFAPYYWEIGLEGFADSDNGHAYGFRFTNDGEDFKRWPELKRWLWTQAQYAAGGRWVWVCAVLLTA